jgi:L-threonylcarbamoyladenylate synthase
MSNLTTAINTLNNGGLIAYPTEAVYGLGCDPMNEIAAQHLLSIKNRSIIKGFILIAANWQQLESYVTPLSKEMLGRILPTWPGPVTWILPTAAKTPLWIKGAHDTVAVRVTDHPIAKSLCEQFGGAIVSTSANVQGKPPTKTAEEVKAIFDQDVFVVEGQVGGLAKPTEIRDGVTGKVLRQ